MSDDEKASIQVLLEDIWQHYAGPIDQLNHDLVVMAIPRYPSNIEAIAALDVTALRMALWQFMKAREVADEKPSIRASGAPGEAEAQAAGSGLQHELDARSDPAGASAQPADPANEQGQGDPAAGSVERGE